MAPGVESVLDWEFRNSKAVGSLTQSVPFGDAANSPWTIPFPELRSTVFQVPLITDWAKEAHDAPLLNRDPRCTGNAVVGVNNTDIRIYARSTKFNSSLRSRDVEHAGATRLISRTVEQNTVQDISLSSNSARSNF